MTTPIVPPSLVDREPVLILLAGLAAIVDLGLVAAVALDWLDLTNEQTAAVVAFVTALTGLIAAVTRAAVYSPATVAELTAPESPL